MATESIRVYLADDNLIVREGVRALINREPDLEIVGVAADYDELMAGAGAAAPQVLVTDIRMPPTFQREGIEAAKELRKMHPGTGIVVLSQYDDPEYAISLLSDGAAGYAYLLKDRIRRGRPARSGGADRRNRRHDPRSGHRRHADATRGRRRGARPERRGAAAVHRRGSTDEGDRRRPADHTGSGGRRRRGPVPQPGARGVEWYRRWFAPASAAPPGHRRPGGAG